MDLDSVLKKTAHTINPMGAEHKWYDAADVIDLQTKVNYIVQRCEGCPLTKHKQHG